jgi:hypothetical protein
LGTRFAFPIVAIPSFEVWSIETNPIFMDIHYQLVTFCANTFIQRLETILLGSSFVLFACGGIGSKAKEFFLWNVTSTRLLERDGRLRVSINISERSVTLRNQSLDVFSLVASRQPLWPSGQNSWLHNGDIFCFL